MKKLLLTAIAATLLGVSSGGCGKTEKINAFPGTDEYYERVDSFHYTPEEAYELARETAEKDRRLQFLSKQPTAIRRRWYIFSFIQMSGASLQGYHVNGDTGEVIFFGQDRVIHSGF